MIWRTRRNYTPESRAVAAKRPGKGLIHHSARGRQSRSHASLKLLCQFGMQVSMSRQGHCWNNAPMESFFIRLKNEREHGSRYSARAAAEADRFDDIEPFYNRRRKHSTLSYASPMKLLEDWITAQHEQKLAA